MINQCEKLVDLAKSLAPRKRCECLRHLMGESAHRLKYPRLQMACLSNYRLRNAQVWRCPISLLCCAQCFGRSMVMALTMQCLEPWHSKIPPSSRRVLSPAVFYPISFPAIEADSCLRQSRSDRTKCRFELSPRPAM